VAANDENSSTVPAVYSTPNTTPKDNPAAETVSTDGETDTSQPTEATTSPNTFKHADTTETSTVVPTLNELVESEGVTSTEATLQSTEVPSKASVNSKGEELLSESKEALADVFEITGVPTTTDSTVKQDSTTLLATTLSTTPATETLRSSTVDTLQSPTEAQLDVSNLSKLYSPDGPRDVEVRCRIIPDISPCTQADRGVHWYFDAIEQRCLSTTDCISNENNFESELECMTACHHKTRKFTKKGYASIPFS
ncbi:unnamed protein product, partial [Dibothriocephalus latus]